MYVSASASSPGSVARSSADVLTAPAPRSGCPSMVDMVRCLFCVVFGWQSFRLALNCYETKRKRNNNLRLSGGTPLAETSLRRRLARFCDRKKCCLIPGIDQNLSFAKVLQQFHVRACTKSHWQKLGAEKIATSAGLTETELTDRKAVQLLSRG